MSDLESESGNEDWLDTEWGMGGPHISLYDNTNSTVQNKNLLQMSSGNDAPVPDNGRDTSIKYEIRSSNANSGMGPHASNKCKAPSGDVLMSRMALNDHKAGMEGLDRDTINRIILENSKGMINLPSFKNI